jgi:predicted MPP superfamily phosphohydrolase
MRIVLFMAVSFLLFAAPAICLRWGFPGLWKRWLSRVVLGIYGFLLACVGLYFYFRVDAPDQAQAVVTTAQTLVIAGMGIVLTSLLWGPLMVMARRGRPKPDLADPQKRALLLNTARAIPAASTLLSPVGVQAALKNPIIRPVTISIKDLSPKLQGLKILQLTDVHFGLHIDADQFEKIADAAKDYKPDLVVLTGDIADDYTKLGPALTYLKKLNPKLGIYACIGNHEIYRGRRQAEQIYREHDIGFVCNDGVELEYEGEPFWLAGADDPARLFRNRKVFYEKSIAQAMQNKPSETNLSVLLCHRPIGFDAAAKQGVSLTLSGHTHGGQMAIAGRSIFEPFMPKQYLLGHYQKGESHLYTSAGLGHWLPFRLNCPCEGALIELVSA